MPFKIPVLKKYDIMQTNLRGFQKRAGDNLGNLILRAPTGSGKTLAAILWAQINQKKNGRLFYALPNIASINSMYLRLKEYFHDYVGILHSRVASAIYSLRETDDDLNSKITNQRLAKIVNSLSREMWFPIRVCTPHQILRYTLQGKGWETMLSEFPNSCFIFDEIHAYDPTVTGLTLATAKFLKTQNASCLFLSATMPTFIRKILEDEIQSITFLEPSKDDSTDRDIIDQKRHSLEIIDGDMLSNIDTIIKESEKAKSTLIVCNHVPSAQKIYDEIQKRIGNTVLLHSRFCRRDRNKIEYQIRKSLPKVLVSTQVVEVSLDIDFDQGFSEPAPIDALVQRLGRINRFGRQKQPATVRIFRDQLHHFNIYDDSITIKSLRELQSVSNPLREQDLIEAADRVYVNGYNEENRFLYEQALNHPRIKTFEELLVSGTSRNWIDDVIRKSDSTIDMLPESLLKEYEKLEKKDLKIEAYNLLVPVPIRVMHYMNEVIDKTQDPWIIKMPYSEKIGLSLDKNIEE